MPSSVGATAAGTGREARGQASKPAGAAAARTDVAAAACVGRETARVGVEHAGAQTSERARSSQRSSASMAQKQNQLPHTSLHSTSLLHTALASAPSCGARLLALPDAARGCPLLVSAHGYLRVVVARLRALPSAQPPASHDAQLPALLGAV
jgi:hypothetical protein